MTNTNDFISAVKNSRKRTGIIYCRDSFTPLFNHFKTSIPEICFIDCADFYNNSLIFSAKELLDKIEYESKSEITIITNLEAFIVSNSSGFQDEIANLLSFREPVKPIFIIFYSGKLFQKFKYVFESKELNQYNILEF